MIKNILIAFVIVSVLVLGYFVLVDKPKVEVQPEPYQGEYLQVLSDPYTQTEVRGGLDTFNEIFGDAGMRPSNFKTTLARSLSATASTSETIYTTSLTTKDDHALTSDDIGDFVCFHINPGASNDEICCCTGITSNNFTGCTRGYAFYATSVLTGNEKAHSPGETIVISNDDHYLTTQYPIVDAPQTITGEWTFSSTSADTWILLGPGNTTYDKGLKLVNGETNVPFLMYDESANTWVVSNNGVDSITVGGSTATFTGGDGILITASDIDVEITSNSGLYFESDRYLAIYASTSNPLFIDDDGEIQVSTTASFTFNDITLTTGTITHASVSDDLTLGTPLGELQGGTGTASWDKYDICYISADNTFGAISSGSDGNFLTMTEGVPSWSSSRLITESSETQQQLLTSTESTAGDSYVVIKDIEVKFGGVVSASFELRSPDGAGFNAYGRIYLNGAASGTERTNQSTTFITYSQNITVEPYDNIQLYIKSHDGGGQTAEAKNFKLEFDVVASSSNSDIIDF